jgi:uncharacterized membrane protein
VPGAVEQVLDRHEELAETARNFAIAAGALGFLSCFVNLRGILRHAPTVATAIVSLICVYYIVQTAHLGGKMVYQHGVGTTSSANSLNPNNPGSRDQNGESGGN